MGSSSSLGRDRWLTAALTVTVLATLLVAVANTAPALAAAETVNFVGVPTSTPEGSVPTVNLQLQYANPLAGPVSVTVTAAPGAGDPAEAGDYNLSATPVVFPSNAVNGAILPVPLTFVDDALYENSETIVLTIANVVGGTPGPTNTFNVTIANNDDAPTVAISDSASASESGTMLFTVTRTGFTELVTTAIATPTAATATAGTEFGTGVQAVSIAAGGATATDSVSVPLFDDNLYEGDETLNVTLSALGAANPVGSDLVAVGTITDDDPIPTLSINDVGINEGNGTATFTITRVGQTALNATVDVATSGLTATAGDDYIEQNETITIPAGGAAGSAVLVVPIVDDDLDEDNETYEATLSNPTAASISVDQAIGTIIDNDTAGLVVDVGSGVVVLEGDTAGSFDVTLATEPAANVVVTPTNIDTQTSVLPSSLTFTPSNWDTPQAVFVSGVEDGTDETDPHSGTVRLTVSSTDDRYSTVSPVDVAITIGDADALLVTIAGPSVGAPGVPANFTAAVNAGATGDITYAWSVFHLGNEIATGSAATFEFTPTAGGPHVVQVIVGDSEGQNPAEFIQFRSLGDIQGSIFKGDIVWLAGQGITKGCNPPDNDLFCPSDVVTRGQMAAFLVRFLGLTEDGGGNTFTDDNGSIFEDDIAKLAAAGITKGCNPPTNTNFCPTAPVTREQMAAFMVRALGLTEDGGGNTFTDDNGSVFEDDIAKLAAAGITKGCNPPTNTNFCPTAPVTREQMAAFIRRGSTVVVP